MGVDVISRTASTVHHFSTEQHRLGPGLARLTRLSSCSVASSAHSS